MAKPLVFNPSKPIKNSPLAENAFLQCVDRDTVKGTARINFATELTSEEVTDKDASDTFIRNGTLFIDTTTSKDWVTGSAVRFTSTGTLPAGLSTGVAYYLKRADSNTFGVYPTFDDAVAGTNGITLSDDGTGTHTVTSIQMVEVVKLLNDRAIDTEGNFWQYSTGLTQWHLLSKGSGSGNGFIEWQGYAFLFRGGNIDTYRLSNGTLTAAWQTDSVEVALVGEDDIVYMGDDNDIRSLQRGTGSFNPAAGATYNYNSSALDLPNDESIVAIGELASFLSIASRDNKYYLWDRASSSFEIPVTLPGEPQMIIDVNNLSYVVLENGDMVATNGTTYQTVLRFPEHIFDQKDFPSLTFNPNGWRVVDDKIFIAFGSTSTTDPMGVYSFNITTGDFQLEHVISTGATGGSSEDRVRTVALQEKGIFFISWVQGGDTFGIDRVSITNRYTGNQAKIYSALVRVGTARREGVFKQTEIQCSENLSSGQAISVYYRKTLEANWKLLGTFNTANKKFKVIDKTILVDTIQLKVEMDSNDGTTPNLFFVELT